MSKKHRQYGQNHLVRSNKDSVVLIKAMDNAWSRNPEMTFSQMVDKALFAPSVDCAVRGMRFFYPDDIDVVMVTEALYKRCNTPADIAEIQLAFGNPGKIRSLEYREKYLERFKKLFKKNPKLRVVQILSPAVMGKGFFSYLTDEEVKKRLS
ncbi:MAG: hypothetical protein AAB626_02665 [Patescibacteria group bacterium]